MQFLISARLKQGQEYLHRRQWTKQPRFGLVEICEGFSSQEIKNESGQCFTKYTGHRGAVNSISIHSTKHLAITGSGNSLNHVEIK